MLKKDIKRNIRAGKWSDKLVDKLANGEVTFRDFQLKTASMLRTLKIEALRSGKGGKDKTFALSYLTQGRQLKNGDYVAMRNFFTDISEGKLSTNKIKARLKTYWKSSRQAYEQAKQELAIDRNDKYMLRVLANVEHCAECIAYAQMGVQRIGDLPLPTEACTCRSNCRCSVLYGTLEQLINYST